MTDLLARLRGAASQEQFLDVVSRDEAEARFRAHLTLAPLAAECVPLAASLNRILAREITAGVDVPGFDRAGVDGFALRAADIASATEDNPAILCLNDEVLTPGTTPARPVTPGTATIIATGGMIPRGADAVVMVENTEARPIDDGTMLVEVTRPATPGQFIAAAGSDLARGETVLRAGTEITSREIAMLAAIGLGEIQVWRRPVVAILSTGDELVEPGQPIRPGQVYDSNAAVLEAAVTELGATPLRLGILPDEEAALAAGLDRALGLGDVVLLSGGTSKGAGDLAHRVVGRLRDPGVVVHGVALKPGKPLCLAVHQGRPVAILPGFPTSAIFTFHEFLAPVILALGGRPAARPQTVPATLPLRIVSERGRTEYVLASLVHGPDGALSAYPITKGSGAVTTFAQADGFFAIRALAEHMPAGTPLDVTLLGAGLAPADLVIIGSHCAGLDRLILHLEREGLRVKALNVGSSGGLAAARRGECDIAPVHLLDPASGIYNRPFLTEGLILLPGYGRKQGIVFRRGDPRFACAANAAEALAAARHDPGCLMVNRNAGSGTRILIDGLLGDTRPEGYAFQAKSHNGVAVAVAQGRADWGMAIETVARAYGLGFLPVRPEQYDFVVPAARADRPAVRLFRDVLARPGLRAELRAMGFAVEEGGEP
jgi:putative molybdopterin biosynthesis protein